MQRAVLKMKGLWPPKMKIINLLKFLLSLYRYTCVYFFLFTFILIQMPKNLKYDLKKLSFSCYFHIFSMKLLIFKQFSFQKTLSNCLHQQKIFLKDVSIEDISDKKFALVQSIALYIPFKKKENATFLLILIGL